MIKGIREIAEICASNGIKHVVLSPGSRCAPLTISFTENKAFTCYRIIDERSAAFFALGLALGSNSPVALICTSGSAVLNYGPALSEAFYSDVPLLALTADRPAYKIGHQDGQAINQVNVFQNYVHKSLNVAFDGQTENSLIQTYSEFEEAFSNLSKGPVHVNFQFDEPLYEVEDINSKFIPAKIDLKVPGFTKEIPDFSKKRILIIAGQTEGSGELNRQIESLEKFPQVIVVGEAISNINADGFIANPNEIIRHASDELKTLLQPDIVLTFGKGIVSKIFKGWLMQSSIKHYHIDKQGRHINTYKQFTDVFQEDVLSFLKRLEASLLVEDSSFAAHWQEKYAELHTKNEQASKDVAFSDIWAYKEVLQKIDSTTVLHVANSMGVRYVNFLEKWIPTNTTIWVNRGVSGIDGSNSSALGISLTNNTENWLLTGDLAFQYDSNAFWNQYVHNRFKVIVFNNAGGGIFRMINGPSSRPGLLSHFETPIESSAEGIALRSKMDYFCANNKEEVIAGISKLKASENAAILEIFTDSEMNEVVYKNWISLLK